MDPFTEHPLLSENGRKNSVFIKFTIRFRTGNDAVLIDLGYAE